MDPGTSDRNAETLRFARARQDVALAKRVRSDMVRNSPFQMRRLDRAAKNLRTLDSVASLGDLAPMTLLDVRSVSDLLSTPGSITSKRHGPVVWSVDTAVPISYSRSDLDALARLGAQSLERFGFAPGDVIINMIPTHHVRDHNQIALGARRARMSHVVCQDVAAAASLDASVLVGSVVTLTEALQSGVVLHRLHTLVMTGHLPSPARLHHLEELAKTVGARIVRLFAPEGALAAWASCWANDGLHTWPDSEIIELVDAVSGMTVPMGSDGVVLWTGTGWRCSTMLRVQLPLFASMRFGKCEHCGLRSPRIEEVDNVTSFCDLLDATDGVRSWAAELHGGHGGDELWIWVSLEDESGAMAVLASLTESLGDGARIEMSSEEAVRSRIEAAKGERFGDRRSFARD